MVATDIESCTRCSIPILPGDEIIVRRGEVMHLEHVSSVPAQAEPTYV